MPTYGIVEAKDYQVLPLRKTSFKDRLALHVLDKLKSHFLQKRYNFFSQKSYPPASLILNFRCPY